MIERAWLLDVHETFTPDDFQTHRRYRFGVPDNCAGLEIHIRYSPKFLSEAESVARAETAIRQQTAEFAQLVGDGLAARWAADIGSPPPGLRVSNLVTLSLDDAHGAYRGAAHRQANDQHLALGPEAASPGLVAGALPAGDWCVTLSAHTLVSPQCAVSIQIGAEIASSA